MHRAGSFLCAVPAMALSGQTANADPGSEGKNEVFGMAPTDRSDFSVLKAVHIERPQDAAAQLDRIESAAGTVCASEYRTLASGENDRRFAKCRRQAVSESVEKLGAAEVTRAFDARRN